MIWNEDKIQYKMAKEDVRNQWIVTRNMRISTVDREITKHISILYSKK